MTIPPDFPVNMAARWDDIGRGKEKVLEQKPSHFHFVYQKSDMD
jgi:hypothetical protein